MERTKQNPESETPQVTETPKKYRYRLLVNRFKFNGRTILKGGTFEAYPSQIPEGFSDLVERIEIPETDMSVFKSKKPKPGQVLQPPAPVIENLSEPRMERRTGAWWDVYDMKGEKVNSRALRKEDADKVLELAMTQYKEVFK